MYKKYLISLTALLLIASIYLLPSLKTPSLITIQPHNQLAQVSSSLTDGLVGWWKFDEGSGTTASDSSGNGNTGTFAGGIVWTNKENAKLGAGALRFDGTSGAVSISSDLIGTESATINAWIKPKTIPYIGVIASNNSNGFNFRVAQSFNRLQCSNSGSSVAFSAVNSIIENMWHMVTAVRNSDGTCSLYVNGILSGALNQNAGSIITGNSGLTIGRRPASAYPFDGVIDDVRVYSRSLGADEIMQLYTDAGGIPPPILYNLTINTNGSGSVMSSPSGINCGSACSNAWVSESQIILTATPSPGSTFIGWSGSDCIGVNTCTVDLNADVAVSATFKADNPPQVDGNIVTSHSCSQIDVQAAIDTAYDGGTVIIPPGSCAWTPMGSSGPAVAINNKSITLRGAGINQTNITLTDSSGWNQSALAVNMLIDKPFRITGLTFNGNGYYAYIAVGGHSTNFRIDNVSNKADTDHPSRLIAIVGNTSGVIDHVQASAGESASGGMILIRGEDATAKMTGNTAWMRPVSIGTGDGVYIEDSVFIGSKASFTSFATDIENGGKIIFRNNTVMNLEFGSHGAQSSGGRGGRVWEIYNNKFILNYQIYSVMVWLRGGTGVIFNNIFERTGGGYGYYIAFDNPRSHSAYGTFGSKCDGTNQWDGNLDSTGYPCVDQIGRSTGNPGHQLLVPAYEWNNKIINSNANVDIVVINQPSNIHIVQGRDYFTDKCPVGYIPYIYPHPLVQQQDGVSAQSININCSSTEPGIQNPPPPPVILGDFNNDNYINSLDISILFSNWNTQSTTCDLNKDGIVNSLDYVIVVKNWTV